MCIESGALLVRRWSQALCVLTCLVLASCSMVGPDYEAPEIKAPPAFVSELESGLNPDSPRLGEWWQGFQDKKLDGLIERALGGNLDLAAALSRISEAAAFRGVVATDLVPRVDLGGGYTRSQTSEETPLGGFGPRASDLFSAGFTASWEIDLWGRIRRQIEAADADIDASLEDARAVLISVMAEVASAYVDLRTVQARAEIVRANSKLQAQTVSLTNDRFTAGLVSELDVAQARSNLESTRAALPALEVAARAQKNRIAVLLGLFPGALEEELKSPTPIPWLSSTLSVGIPADIIRRRPDIRFSERSLAAATARIGVAEADLYPAFSLSGNLGVDSDDLGQLFKQRALGFGFSPAFNWNVFDRDRIRGNIEVQNQRQKQALIAYEASVLRALEEVENAMTGFTRDQAQRDILQQAVVHTRRAVELSRDQYRQGLVSFQTVLDTQSRLFDLEDQLVLAKASVSQNVIALYRSLGGGWEARDIVIGSPDANDQQAEDGE